MNEEEWNEVERAESIDEEYQKKFSELKDKIDEQYKEIQRLKDACVFNKKRCNSLQDELIKLEVRDEKLADELEAISNAEFTDYEVVMRVVRVLRGSKE